MTGQIVALLAPLLTVLLDLAALLLVLEWLAHLFPGAWPNFARRALFNAVFPLLKWNEHFLSIKWGPFHSRGLLLAVFLLAVSYLGVPWLVLLSYSLRHP
jgi:hypothetical protein